MLVPVIAGRVERIVDVLHLGGAGTYRSFVGRQRPQGVTIAFAMNFQDDPSPLIFPVVKTLVATHR
jgi:hypothetical protein